LPSGLKIVNKLGFLDNRYELLNLEQIEVQKSFMDLRDCCQDNMLTLMKSEEGIELAICVCMYNEDKIMLKSTLAGVTENISNLVSREKISSDKIGVFVLMDGIEKVDSSVVDYFEELERMNNIKLGDIGSSISFKKI
jgi:hypothetical protein